MTRDGRRTDDVTAHPERTGRFHRGRDRGATRPSHPVFAALYDPLTRVAEQSWLGEHRVALTRDLRGRVLDLGAGTGATFPYLRAAAADDPSLSLVAVEPDPHMRRRAVARADDLSLDVSVVDADAQALPFADDTFDVVVAALVFCTVPDVDAALAEVARVLAPGGEFRVLEHVRADGWSGRAQELLAPAWRRVAGGCHLTRRTGERFAADPRFRVVAMERFDAPPPAAPLVRGTLALAE